MIGYKLAIITSLKVIVKSEKKIFLTKKFINGIIEYQKYWHGKIVIFIEESKDLSNNLDNKLVDLDKLPFQVEIVDFDNIQKNEEFSDASVVLTSIGFRQNHISKICKIKKISCFYVTEYSLKTRMQIIDVTTHSLPIRLRRYVWEILQEIYQRKAIAIASGVQCNGTPTFNQYCTINPNSILYFDTRIRNDMLSNKTEVKTRSSKCLTNYPLRLLFSGRLIKIKGVDHLIPMAQKLHKLGIEFELFICGDGDLKDSIQKDINQSGLSNSIHMLGVLDFENKLVPFIKQNIDIFVCCHRQGDPSCTYLEIMSCGVPIVGYSNEAFVGIVKHSQSGWLVKMNRPDLLARKIAWLNNNRKLIVYESYKSLEFAKLHTFEKTFKTRIKHIETGITL